MIAVSDMDAAWFARNGRLINNEEFVQDFLPLANNMYGTDVIQHGPHVPGVLEAYGAPLENLSDIVYVYGSQGFIGEGSMLDTMLAIAPSSRQEFKDLWQQLATHLAQNP